MVMRINSYPYLGCRIMQMTAYYGMFFTLNKSHLY